MFVKERFVLAKYTQDTLRNLEPKFGYDGYGEFVYFRTYSRIKKDGSQENWADTIIRVVEGVFSIRKDWYLKNNISWDEKYWQEYAYVFAISMFNMEWMPAGRGLWAMGTEFVYERGGMALQNCGFTDIINNDIADDLCWSMDALMLGVGVGFSPIRDDTFKFKMHYSRNPPEFVIPDSREGWVESISRQVNACVHGTPLPRFIYDEIRKEGELIKGFGGIASGPQPLIDLHCEIPQLFDRYMSEPYYDSVMLKTDCMNLIGKGVVAGGVRRTAELGSLSIKDPVFKDLKDYKKYPYREKHGWMSNNSCDLEDDADFERLDEIAERVIVRGEPGIKNLQNFPFGRIGKKIPVRRDRAKGTNPCRHFGSFCLTKNGLREFGTLKVGDYIWSKEQWTKVTKIWSTGINDVYRYRTTGGTLYCTEDHRVVSLYGKVKAKYASTLDVFTARYEPILEHDKQYIMDGLVLGDGTVSKGYVVLLIGEDDTDYFSSEIRTLIYGSNGDIYKVHSTLSLAEVPLTYNRRVPKRFIKASKEHIASFLRGVYSANGSICGNRITLKSASLGLIEDVQLMLSSIGIASYYTTNKSKVVQFSNGKYTCKQSYDLNITNDREKFHESIGFLQQYKNKIVQAGLNKNNLKPEKTTYDIMAVELYSREETFDITVENESHTYWAEGIDVSNCGEQLQEGGYDLDGKTRVRETCNIDETYPTVCNDPLKWLKGVEHATFYCSTVSLLLTHQPSTNRVLARNRRIGVGIVDITGWIDDAGVNKVTKWMRKGYDTVTEINQRVNGEAGIPESIRKTTVKPGGTTPKLAGKVSGIGYATFNETLRRSRISKNHPLVPLLMEANIPYEEDIFDRYTWVFEYPIIQTGKPAYNVTLWQQAMNLVLVQREWSDNSVSNTLYFKPKWVLVKIFDNFYNKLSDLETYIQDYYSHDCYIDIKIAIENEKEEYENVTDRLTFRYDDETGDLTEAKVHVFDPKHEENDIEPVLSMIAPLIKTASLLPHSNTGAYKQMPEEGITHQEYLERKSKIKPIDWNKLSGSDGVDERYCQGDSCERKV